MQTIPKLASATSIVHVHEIDKTKPIKTFDRHIGRINCVVWSHNAKVLASAGDDGCINLIKFTTGDVLRVLKADSTIPIQGIMFSNTNTYLAACYGDGCLRTWFMESSKRKEYTERTEGSLMSLSINKDNEIIASGSNTGRILLFKPDTTKIVSWEAGEAETKYGSVNQVLFSVQGEHKLGSCTDNGAVQIWDINTRQRVSRFKEHSNSTKSIAFSPVNELLMCSVGIDSKLNFYDSKESKIVKVITAKSPLSSLSFHEDGYTVACGTLTGDLLVYDLRANKHGPLHLSEHPNEEVNSLQFLPSPRKSINSSRDSDSITSIRNITPYPNASHTPGKTGYIQRATDKGFVDPDSDVVTGIQSNIHKLKTDIQQINTKNSPTYTSQNIFSPVKSKIGEKGTLEDISYTGGTSRFKTFEEIQEEAKLKVRERMKDKERNPGRLEEEEKHSKDSKQSKDSKDSKHSKDSKQYKQHRSKEEEEEIIPQEETKSKLGSENPEKRTIQKRSRAEKESSHGISRFGEDENLHIGKAKLGSIGESRMEDIEDTPKLLPSYKKMGRLERHRQPFDIATMEGDFTEQQKEFVRETVEELLGKERRKIIMELREDIHNVQFDMVRQSTIQLEDITRIVAEYSVTNSEYIHEMDRLREENNRLKKNQFNL